MGATISPGEGVDFCVWASRRRRVEVVIEGGPGARRTVALAPVGGGWHEGRVPQAIAGTRYRYRLDGGPPLPDPASRSQPDGPHGASEVIDPSGFRWTDSGWRGLTLAGQVLYELHLGTFTPEGTYAAAAAKLPLLKEIGVTAIELMPVAEFAGRRGWGYDGVDWFAPTRVYGGVDDLRALVDRAHALGMGVILDVVYNHFGPDGAWWREYSEEWFSHHGTEWGEAINFDGPGSDGPRAYVCANAAMWIGEYHLDGLRVDATQDMHDASAEPIVRALARSARAAANGRDILVIAENEPQHTDLVLPAAQGGSGLDAVWCDDFHHAARVAATGRAEAYLADYRGTPQELISATRWGYLFQGQRYAWQAKRRGSPTFDLPGAVFVTYLQNHDQIANSARGLRLHQLTSPGRYRALTAWWLLGPGTPLLFQGQEFGASAPFAYFCDHEAGLAPLVRAGRAQFVAQFPSVASPEMQAALPDPGAEGTWRRCVLDWAERDRHGQALALHRDLLALRREDPTFAAQRADRLHGAVLGPEGFVLRHLGATPAEDRLLLVNLGLDLVAGSVAEPLVAPPAGCRWRVLWSSEHPAYGGGGTPPIETGDGWRIPGHATLVLAPEERADG